MESDHQHAVASQAVERYLLGDLEPALRDRFENHFFGCPTCAEALRTGAVLEEAARALIRATPSLAVTDRSFLDGFAFHEAVTQGTSDVLEPAAADSSKGWMPRPALRTLVPWAVAVFFAVLSFQQYRELSAPRIESASALVLRADSRGAALSASAPAGQALALSIDVPKDGPYRWTLHPGDSSTPANAAPAQLSGEATAVRGSLVIVIGAGTLSAGTYTVALAPTEAPSNPLPDRLYYFELTRAQKN